MPAVLVHGVPDTAWMWDPLRSHLERDDVVALELPGFGTDVPAGFGATKEEYADWITAQLRALGEPVDLVGHDWGCLLAQRVTSLHPELVRTLVCGSGPVDREYVWHPMAQLWQTPGSGEEIIEGMLGLPRDDLVAGLIAGGAPPELAARQAERLDARMGHCTLELYRSAVTVGAEWEDGVAAMPHRPVLVLWGRDDPYVGPEYGERLARRVDGELRVYDGCSHWWPWERAEEAAHAINTIWAGRGRS
jgi:pimeloyl-ACP methyl ester carboxylesterase